VKLTQDHLLSKAQIRSFDYAVSSCYRKIFNVKSNKNVRLCMDMFAMMSLRYWLRESRSLLTALPDSVWTGSRDIWLASITIRLGVLKTWVLVSRRLETRFYKSWSWSWNPRVSVSVLGLATMKTRFSSLMKREIVRLPPLLLWNGYLATVVCWCRQTGLEWVTTCCHSWSTCDVTISCKFSCCCTVGISL